MVIFAKILLFIYIVLISAVLGAAVAFFGVIVLAELMGASNINGGLAMGAVGYAPVGGLVGAGLGAWLFVKIANRAGSAAVMGAGFGFLAVSMLAVAGWFVYQKVSSGSPYRPGKEPIVLIEWRLPDTLPAGDAINWRFMMRSSYMNWILPSEWDEPASRQENGHTILRMRVTIRWRVTGRTLQLWRAPQHDKRMTITPDLPRDPPASDDFGPWHDIDSAPGNAYRLRIIASSENN